MPKRVTEKIRKIRRAQRIGEIAPNAVRKELQLEITPNVRFWNRLIAQVNAEYELCWRYCRPKIKENFLRLSLYNNQTRSKDRFGDPYIFEVHQEVLANLYDDKLGVSYGGRTERDEDVAENLNLVSEFDYDEMRKAEHDYEWDWDSLAFGRALSYFNEFDFDSLTPIPAVWDTLTFIRDPRAVSVNGNRLGENAMRFGGREIRKTLWEMRQNPEYVNLRLLKKSGEANPVSLVWEARQARRKAQNLENVGLWETSVRENYEFVLLQWLTHIDGEKWVIELANDRTLLVRATPIEQKLWPLIDRSCYPMAHDWDGVNIFDILEDKQRYRAALLNVAGDNAKFGAYPMWLFDENRIRKNVDKSANFAKWIPVNGPVHDAAMPVPHSSVDASVKFILEFLEASGKKALGADMYSMIPQQAKGKRTLGELQKVAAKMEARQSLALKVWGWSERAFWNQHYNLYKMYLPSGIKKKTIRIESELSNPLFRNFGREDLVTEHSMGPHIKIESKIVSEAKKARMYQTSADYVDKFVLPDPNADNLYARRRIGKLLFPSNEVERFIPLTTDERIAIDENKKLNEDVDVPVDLMNDNHVVHARVHMNTNDNPASLAHRAKHDLALMIKRTNPHLFPNEPNAKEQDQRTGNLNQTPQQGQKTAKTVTQKLAGPAQEGISGPVPRP